MEKLRYVKGMECEDIEMEVGLLPGTSKGSWFHDPSLWNMFYSNFLLFRRIAELS